MDLEPERHNFTVGDRVHHFDRLVAGVGRADVSSDRHAAWKLKGSLLVGIREARSYEVLDEPSHLHTEAPQLAVHAVWDRNGLFELAARRELRPVVDANELHGQLIHHEPQPSHHNGCALVDAEPLSDLGRCRDRRALQDSQAPACW